MCSYSVHMHYEEYIFLIWEIYIIERYIWFLK